MRALAAVDNDAGEEIYNDFIVKLHSHIFF